MKTLLLLRHGKSSWDQPSLRDFDRPLAPRGKRDAPRMGELLKERGPLPDLVISSPAKRARETTTAFLKAAMPELTPQFDESIYGASPAELIALVRRLPDTSSCAMLVGHNPAFEELLARLCGSPSRMPTCSLARIDFQINGWADVEDGQGRLVWQLNPKEVSD